MLKSLLFIGGGSFVGGCCRYLLSQLVGTRCVHAFPTSTFVVNVLGCFFIGLLFGLLEKYHHVDGRLGLFLLVGFCGGFTTFSTFSLEAWQLLEKGNYLLSALYALLSVVCCVAGVWIGRKLSGLITI